MNYNVIYATEQLYEISKQVRGSIIEMSCRSKASHLASSLSCVDILVAAYWRVLKIDPTDPDHPDRDRLILSKGHAAQAIYASLAHRGFFDLTALENYNTNNSTIAEHPGPKCMPGIEAATGSLGHGLSLGLGMAMSSRLTEKDYQVFVILGDGECNEGSIWEAAMYASGQKVNNLIAIVDCNGWQGTGRSERICSIEPLVSKWEAFGWKTAEIDGHDMEKLTTTMESARDCRDRPTAIIARTIKGKGVSFMEDDNNWHYRIPTEAELDASKRELGLL